MNFFKKSVDKVVKKRFSVKEGIGPGRENYVRIKITPGSFVDEEVYLYVKIYSINSFVADARANTYHVDGIELETEE